MTEDIITQVNEMTQADWQRIRQKFVKEAMAEWDKSGEGCFPLWVKRYVARRWRELVRSN